MWFLPAGGHNPGMFIVILMAAMLAGDGPPPFDAKVVRVIDADTIEVVDESKTQTRIRIHGIDAPERGQPFAARSRSTLSDLVSDKTIRIQPDGRDRYGRTIGRVTLGGRDVGLAMLEAGMAWHYVKYDQSPQYAQAARAARDAGRGLWADKNPIPPWDWRKLEKSERDRQREPATN